MTVVQNSILGDYRVQAELGRGGMGTVYRAVHNRLQRTVALKVLRDPELSHRFLNEARIQAGLHHPNIATLYDYFECDGRACIAMELVEGETLADRLQRRGAMTFPEAVGLLRPVVEAVAYLHANGVIHRDLKSHNVKVTPSGHVMLLDFGIAKELSARGLTTGEAVPGTPEYLSPEQVRGRQPTSASDVWALGVLLYELVTGDVPFKSPSTFTLFEHITRAEYTAPSARVRGVPAACDLLVSHCLQAEPSARFVDASAFLVALNAAGPVERVRKSRTEPKPESRLMPSISEPGTPPSRRAMITASIVVLALTLAAVGLVARMNTEQEPVPASLPAVPEALVPPADAVPVQVLLNVQGSPADVYLDGVRIGRTPYELHTWDGADVDLELRRDGDTLPLQFRASAGKSAYTLTL